nr:MAG TPA: hypothetical protein [Caudoviricetes sp.]
MVIRKYNTICCAFQFRNGNINIAFVCLTSMNA